MCRHIQLTRWTPPRWRWTLVVVNVPSHPTYTLDPPRWRCPLVVVNVASHPTYTLLTVYRLFLLGGVLLIPHRVDSVSVVFTQWRPLHSTPCWQCIGCFYSVASSSFHTVLTVYRLFLLSGVLFIPHRVDSVSVVLTRWRPLHSTPCWQCIGCFYSVASSSFHTVLTVYQLFLLGGVLFIPHRVDSVSVVFTRWRPLHSTPCWQCIGCSYSVESSSFHTMLTVYRLFLLGDVLFIPHRVDSVSVVFTRWRPLHSTPCWQCIGCFYSVASSSFHTMLTVYRLFLLGDVLFIPHHVDSVSVVFTRWRPLHSTPCWQCIGCFYSVASSSFHTMLTVYRLFLLGGVLFIPHNADSVSVVLLRGVLFIPHNDDSVSVVLLGGVLFIPHHADSVSVVLLGGVLFIPRHADSVSVVLLGGVPFIGSFQSVELSVNVLHFYFWRCALEETEITSLAMKLKMLLSRKRGRTPVWWLTRQRGWQTAEC